MTSAAFFVQKAVSALPTPLVANTLYYVRTGQGFEVYLTDMTGSIAYSSNAAAALSGKAPLRVSINSQTVTAYTAALTDANNLIIMNNAASNTLTIPPASSVAWTIGDVILCASIGAGQTTVIAGSGVTINNPNGTLKTLKQFAQFGLMYIATNTWLLAGLMAEV